MTYEDCPKIPSPVLWGGVGEGGIEKRVDPFGQRIKE